MLCPSLEPLRIQFASLRPMWLNGVSCLSGYIDIVFWLGQHAPPCRGPLINTGLRTWVFAVGESISHWMVSRSDHSIVWWGRWRRVVWVAHWPAAGHVVSQCLWPLTNVRQLTRVSIVMYRIWQFSGFYWILSWVSGHDLCLSSDHCMDIIICRI